jgi:hypothetical protein
MRALILVKPTVVGFTLSTYIISLVLSGGGRPFHPSVPSSFIIRPVIRPSKFLISEEEDDGTGGGGRLMAAAAV